MTKPLTYGDIQPALVERIFQQAAEAEQQRAIFQDRWRNLALYATSHPEIYKQETDPMSITLRIEEIANGWLIHTSEQETDYIGSPFPPFGPYYLPDADAVRRKLPELFDEGVAEAQRRQARYADEKRAYQDDAGGSYAPNSKIYRDIQERGVSGFTIGGGFLRDGPSGAEFVEPSD